MNFRKLKLPEPVVSLMNQAWWVGFWTGVGVGLFPALLLLMGVMLYVRNWAARLNEVLP
jgi:hypothetical protein